MMCGLVHALQTQPIKESACTEVDDRMERIGTDNYPSVRPASQWQIALRVRDIKVKDFGFSWKRAENPVARASRPLGRGHPARAIRASGTLPRQRAGRPRYVRGVIAFTFMSHALALTFTLQSPAQRDRQRVKRLIPLNHRRGIDIRALYSGRPGMSRFVWKRLPPI